MSKQRWAMGLLVVGLMLAGCASDLGPATLASTPAPAAVGDANVTPAAGEATGEPAIETEVSPAITSTGDLTTTLMVTSAEAAGAAAAPPAGMPEGGLPGGAIPAGMGQPFAATPAFADLPYATRSETQRLDIYLPDGDGPFPVVINLHAGGFKFGDKTAIPATVGTALLEAGYAVVGAGYRLSDEATFPAAVLDVRAAVRFLRANAAQYNLDPDRIAAFGQSAGGNLAAMLGTAAESTDFDDASLGNADVSSAVQAVVDWFGPTDFGQMDAQAAAQGCSATDQTHGAASSFESAYLGAPVESSPDLVAQANPITYIDGSEPPFLVQKGDQDCTVPIENTKMLADALSAAGMTVEYELLAGAGHGDTGATPVFESNENVQRVVDFLDTHLGSVR